MATKEKESSRLSREDEDGVVGGFVVVGVAGGLVGVVVGLVGVVVGLVGVVVGVVAGAVVGVVGAGGR